MVKLPLPPTHPSLTLGRIMLETSTLALDNTLIFSCTTKVGALKVYNISKKNWVTNKLELQKTGLLFNYHDL